MANFIPPANLASQDNYFLPKSQKLAVFEEKQAYKNSSGSQSCKLFSKWFLDLFSPKICFSPFCFASPEIIGVKVCNRQRDRQTDRQRQIL